MLLIHSSFLLRYILCPIFRDSSVLKPTGLKILTVKQNFYSLEQLNTGAVSLKQQKEIYLEEIKSFLYDRQISLLP